MREKSSLTVQFGEAVRKARMAANLSQEELADRAGLDRSYLGGIERGERNPTLNVIGTVALGLGIDLGELFTGLQPPRKGG
jgi:transcriptional regulator with XRE-family HTH domain